MNTAGRIYVLSAAIAFVAMASRVGWIDWPVVSHVVVMGLAALAVTAVFLLVIAVVIGIPVALVMMLEDTLWPTPEKRSEARRP